jgi:hypothetical protein
LLIATSSIRIGVTNQGEQEVALTKGDEVAKAISPATQEVATTTPEVVKVTKAVVALINELAEVRSAYNSAKARVEELRQAIFAVVGKADLTLIHHNIEVGRVKEQTKMVVDTAFLKKHYPEAYQASLAPQTQHNISAVTRRA